MPRRDEEPRAIPEAAELIRRDRAMLELRRTLSVPRPAARAAADVLRRRIAAFIEHKNAEKRRYARKIYRLLPIARDLALLGDPREQHSPPPGFARRCRRATEDYDEDTWDLVVNLAGHLHNATTGRIGERKIRKKINLRTADPVDAYVHALSALWSAGRHTPEEVRESIDPERVVDTTATPWFALGDLVLEAVREAPDRQLRLPRWWDLGLLMLLVVDPEFDPVPLGLAGLPPWDTDEPGDHSFSLRSGVLEYVDAFSGVGSNVAEGSHNRVWLLTQRAREHLADAAVHDKPADGAGRGPAAAVAAANGKPRRAKPVADVTRAPLGLGEADLGILEALEKKFPRRILKANLEPTRGPMTRRIISKRIDDLHARGLVDNVNGDGAMLTDTGRALLGAAKAVEAGSAAAPESKPPRAR